MKVQPRFNHWLPKKIKMGAITLYPYILFSLPKDQVPVTMIQHEFVHVRQVRSLGWIRFYVTYLWYSLKYSYTQIPYEQEAYEEQASTPLSPEEQAEFNS